VNDADFAFGVAIGLLLATVPAGILLDYYHTLLARKQRVFRREAIAALRAMLSPFNKEEKKEGKE